jgi:hypothetical protein
MRLRWWREAIVWEQKLVHLRGNSAEFLEYEYADLVRGRVV